jgi:hypothetical protein
VQDKGTFKGRKNEWVMYRSAIISRTERLLLRPINKTMSSIMLSLSMLGLNFKAAFSTFGPTTTNVIDFIIKRRRSHINIFAACIACLSRNGLVIFWQHLALAFKKKFTLAGDLFSTHFSPIK